MPSLAHAFAQLTHCDTNIHICKYSVYVHVPRNANTYEICVYLLCLVLKVIQSIGSSHCCSDTCIHTSMEELVLCAVYKTKNCCNVLILSFKYTMYNHAKHRYWHASQLQFTHNKPTKTTAFHCILELCAVRSVIYTCRLTCSSQWRCNSSFVCWHSPAGSQGTHASLLPLPLPTQYLTRRCPH